MKTPSKQQAGTWLGDPWHFRAPRRRDFLYVGLVGGLSLTLGDYFRQTACAAEAAAPKAPKAKSIIQIFLPGGMAAQESFDPKLYSPVEYRGPLGSIETNLSGVRFGELWKNTARIADKITVVRSMTHGEAAHERGTHNMFTGYRPSPAVMYPSIGSVISHEQGPRKNLPPYVCVPSMPNEFAGSGYLSTAYGPFSVGADPGSESFKVRDLSLANGVDEARFERRKSMLAAVDSHFRTMEKSDSLDAMDTFYQRAYSLISSPEAREAFNLKAEPDAIHDEYGKNAAGGRLLLCRRLVESGVRFVSTTIGGWDHHDNIHNAMSTNVPPLDQAYATLIRDLDRRGMLDSTLVMLTSEFGRTPKINGTAGRDHYPKVFSIVLAGGGIKRGYVHGKSDMTSTDVDESPLEVPNWAATMYSLIGIDPDKALLSPGDRPVRIVKDGSVVRELLA